MNKFYVALGTALVLFGLTGCGESEADKLAKLQMERAQQIEQRAEAARDRRLNNKSNLIGDALKNYDAKPQAQQKND